MMQQLRKHCSAQVGAKEKYVEDWKAYNYTVGGKMYAIIGSDNQNNELISLKCKVEKSEILREQYQDIMPGYYMNKQHWNSIYYRNGRVELPLIEQLIEHSYALIFNSLTKRKQKEILSEAE
ncbi:MmcQ/YjbR family DNA-binding protein [Gracilibacillus saliphilus]|uniref:MmcQ/YjbR family DNA-binding protein n=1 Tax=Gracilibacillus saliphilus TaxID=543890 RepID=UPI0013D34E5D|nr:MmcQ/YjbR family DNA-binding protein [Gracilibacillus saliphilus]